MKRLIANELVNILECWLSRCYSCVKWCDALSYLFIVKFWSHTGFSSVLSHFLFAIYLDDLTRSPLLTRGMFIMVALWNRETIYIFMLWFVLSIFFLA